MSSVVRDPAIVQQISYLSSYELGSHSEIRQLVTDLEGHVLTLLFRHPLDLPFVRDDEFSFHDTIRNWLLAFIR